MRPIRFVMIGGFLGAGKTTAVARLARYFISKGQRVGLVTNDQAYDLVDTRSLRAQGFEVGEVPGACFCCKFDELIATTEKLSAEEQPDVIITEPVGSCTDLVATVIEPLRHLHGDRFEIAPLSVLLKPEHGRRILVDGSTRGVAPQAEYIFVKQIEEAELVVVNKIDKLSPAEVEQLVESVETRFPGKKVLAASSLTGAGFDALSSILSEQTSRQSKRLEIDYDRYAAGEAELGWLNCTLQVTGRGKPAEKFPLDQLLLAVLEKCGKALAASDAEIAHFKLMGLADGRTAVANLVDSAAEVELSLASNLETSSVEVVVNARVATDPDFLEQTVRTVAAGLGELFPVEAQVINMQCFRPSRPEPTHRYP